MSDSKNRPARRLAAQPNLEQLRKQAKELLEGYRAGDSASVAEVHQFERVPDPGAFALHDAQRVLARSYGFASWSKLKAFVDGANIARLAAAVKAGDLAQVRSLLRARPELVNLDMAGNDEHRVIHYAVLARNAEMVRLLMEAGADARKGIYPHRDSTTALGIAREREYLDIVGVIEEAEQRRREAMSCPNATVSPVQDEINGAIRAAENANAMRMLEQDDSLIRACDRQGGTVLHAAAEAMNDEMVAWLLAKGANARKQDNRGFTPLDRAALAATPGNDIAARFPRLAQRLLFHGAEMTVRAAVALADGDRVRELVLENPGLLRDISWDRGGLVTLAVNHGQLEMVRLLLDLGADPDEQTTLAELEEPAISRGMPLWNAAMGGRHEIAELLLDRGADPNANVYASGWPLRNAYVRKDEAMKRLLLARGARPTPYMVAEMGDLEAARKFLDEDPSEETIEELVWSAADHGHPEIVKLALPRLTIPADDPRWNWFLIQPIRGVEPDGEDHQGFFECLRLLLDRPIDPNVSRRFGQTVLHFLAADRGPTGEERARFARMLLDNGARFDLRDDLLKSTALGWACRWGRRELVELLIARGAPVDERDAETWATPLAWAVKMGHAEIIQILNRGGGKTR